MYPMTCTTAPLPVVCGGKLGGMLDMRDVQDLLFTTRPLHLNYLHHLLLHHHLFRYLFDDLLHHYLLHLHLFDDFLLHHYFYRYLLDHLFLHDDRLAGYLDLFNYLLLHHHLYLNFLDHLFLHDDRLAGYLYLPYYFLLHHHLYLNFLDHLFLHDDRLAGDFYLDLLDNLLFHTTVSPGTSTSFTTSLVHAQEANRTRAATTANKALMSFIDQSPP